MNPDTALQTILMAKTSTDLQPIVEQVLINPTYYYTAHELLRNCLATLCMHPLLTHEQAEALLAASEEFVFFLARNSTLILELSTNPDHLNERSHALLQRLRHGHTTTSPSMGGAERAAEGWHAYLNRLNEMTPLELKVALILSLAQLHRKRESTLTLLVKELTLLAPHAFSPWREGGVRYSLICSLLDLYASCHAGDDRNQLRELLRELDVEPWECKEFIQSIANRIVASGYILLIPMDGTPEGDGLDELRDALIQWVLHFGGHAHAYEHTPLFQWFLRIIDVNDLLRSIAQYGTDLDAKGFLDLTTVINALKKEHERSKNESPSTSRSTEALSRDL